MPPLFNLDSVYEQLDAIQAVPPPSLGALIPLLLESPSSRPSRQQQRLHTLSDFDDTINVLELARRKLDDLDDQVRLWRGRLAYSLSLISSLPVEIMTRIFDYTGDDDFDGGQWRSSVDISHVCSYWRRASLAYPPLWTHLRIASHSQMSLFQLFAARISHLKMALVIDLAPSPIRSFEYPPPFCLSLGADSLQQLRSLRYGGTGSWYCFDRVDMAQFASELEVVSFTADPAFLDESLTNVRRLEFETCTTTVHPQTPRPLILSSLEELSCIRTTVESFANVLQIVMPSLRRLTMSRTHNAFVAEDNFDNEVAVESLVVLPALEVLSIDDCCTPLWHLFATVTLPRLRELSLCPMPSWSDDEATMETSALVCIEYCSF